MDKGIAFTGVVSNEEIKICTGVPSNERMKKGKVAVIECVQEIPCNPCEESCKLGAINIGGDITNVPKLIEDRCIGCGVCISKCPGLAITIIDKSNDNYAIIDFPFEYLPIPNVGDMVDAVNREGKRVCKGEVLDIKCPKFYDKTTVITIKVPTKFSDEVRSISRLK